MGQCGKNVPSGESLGYLHYTVLRGSVRAPSGFSLDKPSAAKPRGLRFLGFAALGLPLENHSILGKNELNSYQLAPCIPLQKYWPGPAQTQSLACPSLDCDQSRACKERRSCSQYDIYMIYINISIYFFNIYLKKNYAYIYNRDKGQHVQHLVSHCCCSVSSQKEETLLIIPNSATESIVQSNAEICCCRLCNFCSDKKIHRKDHVVQ